ncbi:MAG: hypothetical protein KZQ83_03155 [gamma proteobacterium symbiont of Taylorina sp.]|nr:hypothetical protein [gamma proteobacterium symbiont of Taylorina sp.]
MIEVVSKNNIDEVLPLISAYQEFYNVAEISDSKNKEFFSQFGESNPVGCQFIYRNNGAARLQWVTAQDNEQAQKLYNSMNTSKSTWYFYTYNT